MQMLRVCQDALRKLSVDDSKGFAAVIQIAVIGAGFSAGEIARASGYDTGTIIKWYQGVMAPPRKETRSQIHVLIVGLVTDRLKHWEQARSSVAGLQEVKRKRRAPILPAHVMLQSPQTG